MPETRRTPRRTKVMDSWVIVKSYGRKIKPQKLLQIKSVIGGTWWQPLRMSLVEDLLQKYVCGTFTIQFRMLSGARDFGVIAPSYQIYGPCQTNHCRRVHPPITRLVVQMLLQSG